ncbi:MAG: glycosyltransferase family 2 protein [bacterium]|nr:glycosyltransferase family 2 protein [bacterium]
MTPKVGIILTNYQDYAERFLADCRNSLRVLNYPKEKYAVYIVDNQTTAATRDYLKIEYPETVLVASEENRGWAGGNNLGVERAWQDGCQDFVFLNMDTVVEADWLKELVAAAYQDIPFGGPPLKKEETGGFIGIVQSKILLHPVGADGKARINSLGNEIHFLGFGFCRGYGEDNANYQLPTTNYQPNDIPYASGASMYVKGDLLKQIGLCDSELFMYHDDLELCWRARLFGWRTILAPRSIVWHKYQFSRSIKQIFFMERNRWLVLLYFYKWPTLVLLAPMLLLVEAGMALYAIKNHWLKAKVSAWDYFLHSANLKKVWQKRKLIQEKRCVNEKQASALFCGKIMFQEISNPALDKIINPLMDVYWRVVRMIIVW